jgi:hypothetical protein
MQLDKKNYEIYAFGVYTNKSCVSKREFSEDLKRAQYARKLVKKIIAKKEVNIRLLLNHVILFTNVFEIHPAKELLMFNCSEEEKSVLKTVLNYLGFMEQDEYPYIPHNMKTAEMLKELKV